ncbi:hypothetical protein J437_LFUL004763 [Ladona fulva]|uniref:DNA polymerase V n=1 Tax=Ladona fulva TaxID=123851 RepID=A0A8K0K086_LADFU|nr:hypothetical protein J437_LFUL004763 [Ladona fulva]
MGEARGEVASKTTKLTTVQSSTLEALRNLGKPSEVERVEAALNLLKRISGKQFTPKDDSEGEKNEVDYVLERLVRGVGASRVTARTGFYSALVALLTYHKISARNILNLVKKELVKGKTVSKSEAADIHMGQVLVYGAIIRSGLFVEAVKDDQTEILNDLLSAGKKRTYITLVAYSFIIQLVKEVNRKLFQKVIWPGIQESCGLNKDWKDRSLDEIYLLIGVRAHFPSIVADSASHLNPDNIPQIASVLVNIPNVSYVGHPVYNSYCQEIAATEHVSLFWSEVEKQLSKPYRNRQLIALQMLEHLVNYLPDKNMIPSFITPLFISFTLKSKSSKRHPQEKDGLDVFVKVKHIFPTIMKNLESEEVKEKTKVEVLKKLLFHPGSFTFEKNTGLKVVQPITTSLIPTGVKKLSKVYREVVSGKMESEGENEVRKRKMKDFKAIPWKNKERIYAAQLLARLIGTPCMANENEWKLNQVKFLLHWGIYSKHFGHSNSDETGFVGVELAHSLRESFFRSLDHKSGGLRAHIDLLLNLVHHVDELLKDDSVEDKVLKGMALEDWGKAVKVIERLEKRVKEESEESISKPKIGEAEFFLMLFLQLSLQLFDWDAGLAADSLAELSVCYEKLEQERMGKMGEIKSPSKKNKKKAKEEVIENGEEEQDLDWVEVVVDLFLHLLSQNRHLLRSMICSVFVHLCPRLTPNALHSILQVLDPRGGKSVLEDKDDESEDEDEENGSGEGSEEEKEESEEDSESGADEEEEPTVNENLRRAVQKALGSSAPSDTESVDLDDMNEEEGKQLDAALSQAFRLLKDTKNAGKAKKQQTKDERSLTHFRTRAVDLLEIYIDSSPSMALCCDLILPLLDALEFCIKDVHQKPLENRLRACLKKLPNLKKFSSTEGMEDDILCDLLNAVIKKGSRTAPVFMDMGNEITSCCTFIIRASEYLRKEGEGNELVKSKKKKSAVTAKITDIYKKSLETFFTRRDCLLPPTMFRQALQLPWPGCWSLVSPLVQFAFDLAVRPFRRTQAFQFLAAVFLNQQLFSNLGNINVPALIKVKEELNSKIIPFLTSLEEPGDASNIRKKNIVGLMNLLHAVRTSEVQIKKIIGDGVHMADEIERVCKTIDWDAIGASLACIYRGAMRGVGPEGKKSVGKMLKLLGLGSVRAQHQKAKLQKVAAKLELEKKEKEDKNVTEELGSESDEEEDGTNAPKKDKEQERREKKKRRKKSSKIETRKLKKETKNFRMMEFSKGLEESAFVGIGELPEDMEDAEERNMDIEIKPKKRKSDVMPKTAKKMKRDS